MPRTIGRNNVFLDTSVLITAVLSTKGGSFYILTQLQTTFTFLINEFVLEETLRVLQNKFLLKNEYIPRLFVLFAVAKVQILPNPRSSQIHKLETYIEKEDASILGSALKHASYLITLDNDF